MPDPLNGTPVPGSMAEFSPRPTAVYLGDGVFVEWDGMALVVTTEDGIAVQNRIVLEPSVYAALVQYVDQLHERLHREALAKAEAP